MKKTSHFIWIELKSQLFVNVYNKIYEYIKINNIENIVTLQNILSIHITLYYLEKNLNKTDKIIIKKDISKLDLEKDIYVSWFDYFLRKWNKLVLYFTPKTDLDFKCIRDKFHNKFNRNKVYDNSFDFLPHITFLKINNSDIFEKHITNIENILKKEIYKLTDENINSNKAYLYSVNSKFKEEIQIQN